MLVGQASWAASTLLCLVTSFAVTLSPSSLSVRCPRVQSSFLSFLSAHSPSDLIQSMALNIIYKLMTVRFFPPFQTSPLNWYPTACLTVPLHVLCHLKLNMSKTPVLPPSPKPASPSQLIGDARSQHLLRICNVLNAVCELTADSPSQSIMRVLILSPRCKWKKKKKAGSERSVSWQVEEAV